MGFLFQSKVETLAQQYREASRLEYNLMANSQVKIVRNLCAIGSKKAIEQVAEFMVTGENHEYMDHALPDTLALHLSERASQLYIFNALIAGMLYGQNETIQKVCIRKLVEARHTPTYKILVSYRNLLLSNERERPCYWETVLSSVIEAAVALEPYIDESIRVPAKILMSNQLA